MSFEIWENARLATLQEGQDANYGLIEDGALVVEGERLAWVGMRSEMPAQYRHGAVLHDAHHALITPGLIDCHTHLVYGGHRANEFELRLNGASYEDIARAGGGIKSTVQATRLATEAQLFEAATKRLINLLKEGVTTLEVKSGYGLSLAQEAKCLRVARQLAQHHPVQIKNTFLGAHAVPPEFQDNPDAYIDSVVAMIEPLKTEGLIDAVDAFCDRIGFTYSQTEKVFKEAQRLNLPVKLHAEQLTDSHGASLAAKYGALSCDHLEWLSEEGAVAMAKAGTVAVLLPGAFYFLRETKLPPIELLRQHQVPMAISTDSNPGSSPCTSILLMLNMACTFMRLTPQEALAGVTRIAAQALGLKDRGALIADQRADFVLWDVKHPAELAYAFGSNPCLSTVWGGQVRETPSVQNHH
jgi:imidazolonepropionase